MRCLAINKSYLPIRIATGQDAICKVYAGNAKALTIDKNGNYLEHDWDEWFKLSNSDNWDLEQKFFSCSNGRVAIPRVIIYVKYDKIPKTTLRLSRKAIYARDNNTCYICGKQFGENSLTLDHIIPVSRGGKNSWENLITCCQKCNWDKGNQLLSEWGKKPKFAAFKPHYSNIQRLKLHDREFEEWKFFGV
ncbi:MAG: HNH endonuclease [Candidatus Ancillula sp.]|jgi:hypothetical protein|nr:HNH endonuclease [Candidatus Ancillula sp.]